MIRKPSFLQAGLLGALAGLLGGHKPTKEPTVKDIVERPPAVKGNPFVAPRTKHRGWQLKKSRRQMQRHSRKVNYQRNGTRG